MGRVFGRVVTAVAVMISGQVPFVAAAEQAAESPVAAAAVTRVMVAGDSVAHASVGDYSWRYFAARHLVASGAAVDFVGPRREPYVGPGETWPALYADPRFDQDHASMWGDSYTWPRQDWVGDVREHDPDVVVLALGTNDLAFAAIPPEQVLAAARVRVLGLQAVSPGLSVVLVEVTRTDLPEARTYNTLLRGLATELDRPEARVVVARASRGYRTGRDDDSVGDTYDPVHPNTRGQVKIAAAVADALAGLGVGVTYPRPLTFPPEGPRVVPTLRSRGGGKVARLRWDVPPGATSFDVWVRAPRSGWKRRVRAHPVPRYGVRRMEACLPYDFRVLARKGWTLAGQDMASPVVTARVGPRVAGRVAVRGSAARRHVTVAWRKVEGGCTYQVEATFRRSSGREVTRTVVSSRLRARVAKLPAGTRVRVRVRAVGAQNRGPWSRPWTVRTKR